MFEMGAWWEVAMFSGSVFVIVAIYCVGTSGVFAVVLVSIVAFEIFWV